LAYGTAKLANILFTRELHRRFHPLGISAAAFHPGVIASSFGNQASGLFKHLTASRILRAFLPTPEKGAGQLVWLAEGAPGPDWASGSYFENYRPARRTNPQVLDDDLARQLWDRSEQLLEL
jgi:NAD(P)-dependent dehydrogenase (short-subunit alcohol dehydrogenase family)